LFAESDFSAAWRQHPHRDLQSLASAIRYNRGTIATLWSALDLYGQTVQWMEWIVNLDFGRFRTEGILGVGAITRMCT
jgi:hypothetical protein